ncbi:ferritin-like domain-containing protein [Paenibacillus oryzae]|nr:ferritin-like domain-containing protein [Paenibacillus oryzae]
MHPTYLYWQYYEYPHIMRMPFSPVWNTNYDSSLQGIKEAVQGERNDELFYDELIKLAPSREQAEIIVNIRNDERGHNKMFREMYRALTGQEITTEGSELYQPISSYREGLQRALQGELGAVEKYRNIWFGLPAGIYKDTVFGVILDELKHASKYNNLITINHQ